MIKKILFGILSFLVLAIVIFSALNFYSNIDVEDLKKEFTYADSKFVQVVGMNVHYRMTGQGKPLVLLHGTGASLHTWEAWTEQLSGDYQIISVDLPAFGLTGKHYNNDYSIQAYTTFLNSFLNKIGVSSFALAGNSLGGRIAWAYALEHPEKVKQLILIDPAGFPHLEQDPPLAFQLAKNPITSQFLLKVTPKSLFVKSLKDVYGDDDLVTEELINRYFKLYLRRGNRQAFIDRVNQEYSGRTDELENIKMPTLIMWGEADYWIPVSDAQLFKNKIPNSELIIYPKVGHVPMEEIPEKTAEDAHAFLEQF